MVKNLKDLFAKYDTEEKCRQLLVEQRWNGKPVCPYCGCDRSYVIEGGKRFKCASKDCYKKYSVTVGTVFEASNIPLTTWFQAMYFISSHKKGISSVQLAKNLGVTQKTGWFMLHRIRESLKEKNSPLLGSGGGYVESDLTFVGGKVSNKSYKVRKELAKTLAYYDNKTSVLGMTERKGETVLQVVPHNSEMFVDKMIREKVEYATTVITDEGSPFRSLNDDFYQHTVQHKKNEFVRLDFHTNSIEGVFSHFKRMYYGTYHYMSKKHLQRYLDEFSYRYNSRNLADGFRFTLTLQRLEGRLSYKRLVYGKGKENTKKEA